MCTSFQSSYHNVNTYTQYPHFNTIMIIPSEILTTICSKFQIVEILDGNIMDEGRFSPLIVHHQTQI